MPPKKAAKKGAATKGKPANTKILYINIIFSFECIQQRQPRKIQQQLRQPKARQRRQPQPNNSKRPQRPRLQQQLKQLKLKHKIHQQNPNPLLVNNNNRLRLLLSTRHKLPNLSRHSHSKLLPKLLLRHRRRSLKLQNPQRLHQP